MGVIVRVDDVSPCTDMSDLNETARFLRDSIDAKVIYGMTLFSKTNSRGSVYPDIPMRGLPYDYFCNVDLLFDPYVPRFVEIASHGLIHAEHAKLDRQAQMMSILVSCNYLKTKKFIPPFMSYNDITAEICYENGIDLVDGDGWKSMEIEPFDATHRYWYFHHWRMKLNDVRRWVNASKVSV